MLHLLQADVCFHLEIRTILLRMAYGPVIREFSGNGEGLMCCQPYYSVLSVFRSVPLQVLSGKRLLFEVGTDMKKVLIIYLDSTQIRAHQQ